MEKHFVRIIDANGLFVRDDFVDKLTEFTIETPCPAGFYLPKWNGEKWVEGKTAEGINAIKASTSTVPTHTTEDRLSALEDAVDYILIGGNT